MSEEDGQLKWDTCAHRSKEQRTTIVRRCGCQGGDYEDSGYDCAARSIFKVTPEICKFCWAYQKAENT